jgi:nitrogen fixation protein NifU and related proteins
MVEGGPGKLMDVDPLMMDVLLEHYRHPHNFGELSPCDIAHEEGNPSCGDQIKVFMRVKNGTIQDVSYSGKGCIISQAAASILTDLVKGEPVEKVKTITKEEMLENIGIPIGPMRLKCALLALKVIKTGLYGKTAWREEDDE